MADLRRDFDLQRFVLAQDGVYATALDELRAGRKRSHWMWFVFPQIAGLGVSATSQHYAIRGLDEARAYLAHPLLGPRLLECMRAVLDVEGKPASQIFGSPDDMKLRSCATLFAAAAPGESVFRDVLGKYFGGVVDSLTLQRLSDSQTPC
jgi:uncharacterized protein (DUF1810 family)